MQPATDATAAPDDWVPACGGTEQPFKSRSGQTLLYMWNRSSGTHAYYDVERDVFLTQEEASRALAIC